MDGNGRADIVVRDTNRQWTIKTLDQPDCTSPVEKSFSTTWNNGVIGTFDGSGFPAMGISPPNVGLVVKKHDAASRSVTVYNYGGSYDSGGDTISFTATAGAGAESWLSPTSFSGTASRSTPFQQTLVFTTTSLGTHSTTFTFTPGASTLSTGPLTVTLAVGNDVYVQHLPVVFKAYDPQTACE